MCIRDSPQVERVYYLGHLNDGDPQYAIYKRQCLAPGAMISFDIRGGEAEAFCFLNHLQHIKLAVSPVSYTHLDVYKRQSMSSELASASSGFRPWATLGASGAAGTVAGAWICVRPVDQPPGLGLMKVR